MLMALFLAEGLTAFCALAFELAVARLVAHYAGMSTDTWTAIIAAFLLAWALGNHTGGRLAADADRGLSLRLAGFAAVAAAVSVAATLFLLPVLDALILAPAPQAIWRIALFAGLPCIPAGFFFGIATPLLIAAVIAITDGRGSAIGGANAMNAAGSVLGALAVLWFLLDGLGTRGAVLTVAALAAINGALMLAIAHRMRRPAMPS